LDTMPVRFTCRLIVVRADRGKLRVKYGPLSDDFVRLLTLHGPEMIIPPDREMTEQELSEWEFRLVTGTGFYGSMQTTPEDAPLVEAKRTYEDQIPKGSVSTELFWADIEGGIRMLAVRVTNGWKRPVPTFSISADYRYDAPQPEQVGHTQAHVLSDSERMFRPLGVSFQGELWPRMTAEFALDPTALNCLQSRAASMSAETYWFALRTDGQEFDRIPGQVVGAFLDEDG
jgi:hypothetical protein